MHIARVELGKIRCFKHADMQLSPTINLLAGENNSGKSTIIQALLLLQGVSTIVSDSVRYGEPNGLIEIWIEQSDAERFPQQLKGHLRASSGRPVRVRNELSSDGQSSLMISVEGGSDSTTFHPFPNQQPHNFLVPYLSDRRTTGYGEHIGSAAALSAGGTLNNLPAKIDRCLTSGELHQPYIDTCMSVLGFVAVSYPSSSGKMAGLEVDARRSRYIPLARLGSGVGQALGLIVELLVSQDQVFLIEELENDLHPTALRALLNLVARSAASGNQFVISTHSNVVLRWLGSLPGARVWETRRVGSVIPPESVLRDVPNESMERRALLRSLGYDLSDYDLYDAWLILEEASAESIVREFIVPLFAPRLSGRIRTLGAHGVPDAQRRFAELHRFFLFIHLEPVYRNRAWIVLDGDEPGTAAIDKLRETFSGWPSDHFRTFKAQHFEKYYPAQFDARVQMVLSIADENVRRAEKGTLARDVVIWLRKDLDRAKQALEQRAREVIEVLQDIEKVVLSTHA